MKMFIPTFDPDNYYTWVHSMKSFLGAKGCFCTIDEDSDNWANIDENQRSRLRRQAFNFLRVSLGTTYNYITSQFKVD